MTDRLLSLDRLSLLDLPSLDACQVLVRLADIVVHVTRQESEVLRGDDFSEDALGPLLSREVLVLTLQVLTDETRGHLHNLDHFVLQDEQLPSLGVALQEPQDGEEVEKKAVLKQQLIKKLELKPNFNESVYSQSFIDRERDIIKRIKETSRSKILFNSSEFVEKQRKMRVLKNEVLSVKLGLTKHTTAQKLESLGFKQH